MARLKFPHSYLMIIRKYLDEKKQKCFTYRGIRAWLYKHQEWRDIEWHTFERSIRKLVEVGLLDRKELSRNKVIFCWNENAERVIRKFLESVYGNEMFR